MKDKAKINWIGFFGTLMLFAILAAVGYCLYLFFTDANKNFNQIVSWVFNWQTKDVLKFWITNGLLIGAGVCWILAILTMLLGSFEDQWAKPNSKVWAILSIFLLFIGIFTFCLLARKKAKQQANNRYVLHPSQLARPVYPNPQRPINPPMHNQYGYTTEPPVYPQPQNYPPNNNYPENPKRYW